jgi:hypothetical protein
MHGEESLKGFDKVSFGGPYPDRDEDEYWDYEEYDWDE